MALTTAFKEAVNSGNIRLVRIMMKDSLLVDPSFKEFSEMEEYAKKSMPNLYDAYDGKELIEDKSLWNKEYMDKMMVKVVSNFSEERIKHLKAVVTKLFPASEAKPAGHGPTVRSNANAAKTPPQNKNNTKASDQTFMEKLGEFFKNIFS